MQNTLLARQLKKFVAPEKQEGLEKFLSAINESYNSHEEQIELLQRAMRISGDELFQANERLRNEAESLKEINRDLKSMLFSMNLNNSEDMGGQSFNPAEYIKQQSEEIVRINHQREELLKNLETQNQELNEYAHMVSHDLKAPLRNISTLIAWVIEDNQGKLDDESLRSLNMILFNAEKMDILIKGILEYSAIDKVELENRPVDLNQLLNEIHDTIMLPPHIKLTITGKLPWVTANPYRFRQLFQNIIENAIKYNDKDNGVIEIGCTEEDTEFIFYIKDNGKGIAEAYFQKIFNIFTKLDNNNNSSGIGLSIVKKIVAYYNGRIWLESTENVGTTFYFTLSKDGTAKPKLH